MRTAMLALAVAATPALALAQSAPTKPAPAKSGKTVGEVVVTGQASPVQTAIDRRSYSVAGDLQTQTGAISDALRNVPQVEVDVQGNVSLRGDTNVTILIDGKPSSLFQGDNKAQALQSLPADSIERVEVVTNPSAEFRADGTAGVINLITKKARGVGRTGSLRVVAGDGDRYAASASGGYNSKRLSLAGELAMRQDTQNGDGVDDKVRLDPASGVTQVIDQQQTTNLLANSFSARGSVDFEATPRTRVGLETHGNYTFFRVDSPSRFASLDHLAGAEAFQRQLSIHQKRAAGEVSANLHQKLGREGEFVLNLSHEEINDPRVRSGHTFDVTPAAPETFDEQRLNYRQRLTDLKGDLTQPFEDMSKLKAGFDVEYVDNDYRNRGFRGATEAGLAPDPALTDNLFLYKRTIAAAYATFEKPLGDLSILAGLRVEDVRQTLDQATLGQTVENDYLRAYPSLHLGWKLSDTQQLTASYSHRVQRPDPLEFNAFPLVLDPFNLRAGNPRLKPQQTQSFELGYEYRKAPTVLLATLYYRENRDGVADVVQPLGGGVFLTTRANLAQSRSAGVELVANGKLSKSFSYSLTANGSWNELESLGPTFAPTRSLASLSGHGTLTWQPTADDLFQLNGFMNGKRLTAQGFIEPQAAVDLGYRHKLSEQLSVVVTLQDLLGSFRLKQSIDTPVLVERIKTGFDTRQVRVGLTWTLGGGRQRDPGFEFQTGAGPPQ